MSSLDRHAAADRDARAHLARGPITVIDLHGLEGPGSEFWRCELRIPHPCGTDMPMSIGVTGVGKQGALDLAHAELRGAVVRAMLDRDGHDRELNQAREALVYKAGELGARRVLAALEHRRHPLPEIRAVERVGLRMSVETRGEATVGDVARIFIEHGGVVPRQGHQTQLLPS